MAKAMRGTKLRLQSLVTSQHSALEVGTFLPSLSLIWLDYREIRIAAAK